MKTWLRLTLVVVSVGGGFAGVIGVANLLFSLGGHQPLYVAMVASIFILYAFVIAGGLVFVYDPRRKQLLQIARSCSKFHGYRLQSCCTTLPVRHTR